MRFVKYKKKKIDELVDDSLNIIDKDDKGSTSIIKSKQTTDQNALRTRQRRDPLAGYNAGGSYGYYFGESEEIGSKEDTILIDKNEIKPYASLLGKIAKDYGVDSNEYNHLYTPFSNSDFKGIVKVLKKYKLYDKYLPYLNLNENINQEIEIIGAPSGQIITITSDEFHKLNDIGLIIFDDEPDGSRHFFDKDKEVQLGQYSFDDDKEEIIGKILGRNLNESNLKAKAKKIVEDLLSKASDSYDVQDTNRLKEIPSLESLEKHHPIVGRNTRILVNSIQSREGVDTISDAIILNELISLIDVESIPYDLKKILIRKLQGGGNSNIVNENDK